MSNFTTRLVAVFVLALIGCKTPPPPQPETFEDDVVTPAQPQEDAGHAADVSSDDAGSGVVKAEADPKPPERKEPETFIAEPKLPADMSFQETALARTVEQTRSSLTFAPILDGGCGIPAAIRASAGQGSGYTVDSCQRIVAAAHAMTYQRTITRLGVIDISVVEIRHDGQSLWSVAGDCTALRQQDTACASDFIVRRPTAMSFVGPVFSYHVEMAVAEAGSPPDSDQEGFVIDVRTGVAAKFDALIDHDSLLNGLKRDSSMRRAVNPTELDAAKKVDEIWKLWRTQDFADFGGYYFADWDAENGLVAMRIWYMEDSAGREPNRLKELEVWVQPKAQWRSAFEDAATETSGFLAR